MAADIAYAVSGQMTHFLIAAEAAVLPPAIVLSLDDVEAAGPAAGEVGVVLRCLAERAGGRPQAIAAAASSSLCRSGTSSSWSC